MNKATAKRGASPGTRSSSLKATIMDQSGAGKAKIGEILSKEGQIDSGQLSEALDYQKKNGGRLGNILLKLGHIDHDTIVNLLGRVYNYPVAQLSKLTVDPEAIKLVDYEDAREFMAFPMRFKGDELVVAMAEPTDTDAVEGLQKKLGKSLVIHVASEKEIAEAFRRHYKIDDDEYNSFFAKKEEEEEEDIPITKVEDFGSLVSEVAEDFEVAAAEDEDYGADQFTANDAPIIKLVNGILIKAVTEGVSDIHIEPFEKSLQVRYRIDGSMFKSMNLPLSIKNAMVSRIKIMAELNIAERRLPQDGRIKLPLGGKRKKKKTVDFRVSILPTLYGESIVMRILDQSALNVDLTMMGFEPETFEALKRCAFRPYGLLLVTGPTGSGKTTTLYSVLSALNKEDTKILTAEDPVEFNFRGINQVPVKEDIGMTFAAALKSFLRQDPDIIMVGEIRDMDTAEIAIKAAMTGHLVFSTLHTNDCPSTIGRLIDIGIPSYMAASAVTMVLSQRLARKLCQKCSAPVPKPSDEELIAMGFSADELEDLVPHGPKGCPACKGTGYKGRVGLFELMEVTDEVGKAINSAVPEDQLRKIAMKEGMVTLRGDGLIKIRKGITSIEEVLKKTTVTKEALPAYLLNPDNEEYNDQEVIIHEGNTDKDFFKLERGAVSVRIGGKKIATISEPNEYFGEMAAITGEARSASIVSEGRSMVVRYPGDKLPETMEKNPEVAQALFRTFAKRLGETNASLVKMKAERDKLMYYIQKKKTPANN